MPMRRWVQRFLRDGAFALLGLAVLGTLLVFYFRPPAERTFRLRLTAGSTQGVRHLLAATLAQQAKHRGVVLVEQATVGSEEALDRVNAGQLDLALVQGGLELGPRQNVRQVSALYIEPLHLLVKEELYVDVLHHLGGLRGRVVNLGETDSGTHSLAQAVLSFVGLTSGPGGYTPATLSYAQLLRETDRDKLPDAVFTVSLPPSPIARHLAGEQRFRLVALPFASAFALEDSGPDDRPDPTGARRGIVRNEVHEAVIPAFTYSVDPPVPSEPTRTLGTRLLLVAHKDVPSEAIGRVLDVAFTTRFARLALPPLDVKVLDMPFSMPPHNGTLAYLDRNKPLIAEDVIDVVEKEFSIAGVVAGGLFFLWQWIRRRVRRRHDIGFGDYLSRILDIERRAQGLESAAEIDLAELLRLQDELGQLRFEALERFAHGELGGEELMSGFLAHAGDARSYITRLILHVRENLEERAQAEGRPARALWEEALNASATPETEASLRTSDAEPPKPTLAAL